MIVYLIITSAIGMSIGATHYYGDLRCGEHSKELYHKLTVKQAADLNKGYSGYTWRPGSIYRGFDSRQDVIDYAIENYRKICPNATILILGSPTYWEPKPVLDGPPEMIEAAQKLLDRAIEINYWDNDPEMTRITKEWERVVGIKD